MLGGVFPAQVPLLSSLLADLGGLSAARLAAVFGVSRSTAHRWIAQDRAPRSVVLALYLAAPSYGQREAQARVMHAQEGQRLAQALAEATAQQLEAVRRELARVLSLGDFGAANAPSFPLPLYPRLHGGKLADDGSGQHGPGNDGQGLGDDGPGLRQHASPRAAVVR